MSAFDSGGILGKIGLDLSDYTSGMLEAEGLSELFPTIITDFLVNPLLAVVDVAKEVGEALFDTFKEVGNAAGQMSFAAEKAGLTIEQYSTLAKVAETVGVSHESLSAGFKLLQKNAEGAVDGSLPKLAEHFRAIGISADFLKEHLDNPGEIFQAVQRGISALPDAAQRTSESLKLLGKGGSELIPLLDLPKQKFDELAKTMKDLGATETEEGGKAGRSYIQLGAIVSAAFEGIKKAFADPLLEKLGASTDEIIPKIVSFAETVRGVVAEALDIVWPIAKGVWDVLTQLGELVGGVLLTDFKEFAPVLQIIGEILGGMLEIIAKVIEAWKEMAAVIEHPIQAASDAVEGLLTGKDDASSGGITIQNVDVAPVDVDDASSQIAAKLHAPLREGIAQQQRQLMAAGTHAKVHKAVRGH